jgi:hypothetical protein
MKNTTCLIGHRVGNDAAGGHARCRVGEGALGRGGAVGTADGSPPLAGWEHAPASSANVAAAPSARMREGGDMIGGVYPRFTSPVTEMLAA